MEFCLFSYIFITQNVQKEMRKNVTTKSNSSVKYYILIIQRFILNIVFRYLLVSANHVKASFIYTHTFW